jgi:hypothetical protein
MHARLAAAAVVARSAGSPAMASADLLLAVCHVPALGRCAEDCTASVVAVTGADQGPAREG